MEPIKACYHIYEKCFLAKTGVPAEAVEKRHSLPLFKLKWTTFAASLRGLVEPSGIEPLTS
jgi:hypothetical protein